MISSVSSGQSVMEQLRETAHRRQQHLSQPQPPVQLGHGSNLSQADSFQMAEIRLRRKIITEVSRLGDFLRQSSFTDEMTNALRGWQERFFRALHLSVDAHTIQDEFIRQLQRMLIDPLRRTPLDEGAVLGSDGRTYGHRSLSLFLSTAREPYNHRSPLDPTNEEIFTTVPHSCVKEALRWLKELGQLTIDDEAERLYRHLEQQQIAPVLPTVESEELRLQNESIRELMAIQAQRNQEDSQRLIDFDRELEEEMEREISQLTVQEFAPIDEQLDSMARRQISRANDVARQDAERLQKIKENIVQLTHEIQALEANTNSFQQQIDSTSCILFETDKDIAQLGILINETEIELKKREKDWGKALLTTVAIVGGCALGTWALQGALLSIGSCAKAAVIPLNNGAGLAFSFPV